MSTSPKSVKPAKTSRKTTVASTAARAALDPVLVRDAVRGKR